MAHFGGLKAGKGIYELFVADVKLDKPLEYANGVQCFSQNQLAP